MDLEVRNLGNQASFSLLNNWTLVAIKYMHRQYRQLRVQKLRCGKFALAGLQKIGELRVTAESDLSREMNQRLPTQILNIYNLKDEMSIT